MKRNGLFLLLALSGALACNNDEKTPDGGVVPDGSGDQFSEHKCGDADIPGTCVQVNGGDAAGLLTQANSIGPNTTIVLGEGTFPMTNAVQIRAAGVHIIGQGIDKSILDFKTQTTQTNGVDVIGNDFLIQDLTVANSKKDGIRVEGSDGVVYRRVKATWDNGFESTNGAYGIYPVKCQHVLVEDSIAQNASDAGLYVGQSSNVIVRNNEVLGNVAGLEIENTEFADVYGNNAHDNTAGIVVFDLPGNPIIGHDVLLRDNEIKNNNGTNFAPGGTVAAIPVGTGTFVMASRRVEIRDNDYANNNTVDIGLVSGLVIEPDPRKWSIPTASLVGDTTGLNLLYGFTTEIPFGPGDDMTKVSNFRQENIVVSGNTHSGSGTSPDLTNPNLPVGLLLLAIYAPLQKPVDSVVYDTIGEPFTDGTATATNLSTNVNHICAGGNQSSFGSLNFYFQEMTNGASPYARFDAHPFVYMGIAAPQFDCTTLNGDPIKVWNGTDGI